MDVYIKFGYKVLWKVEKDDSKLIHFVMYKISFYTALLKESTNAR